MPLLRDSPHPGPLPKEDFNRKTAVSCPPAATPAHAKAVPGTTRVKNHPWHPPRTQHSATGPGALSRAGWSISSRAAPDGSGGAQAQGSTVPKHHPAKLSPSLLVPPRTLALVEGNQHRNTPGAPQPPDGSNSHPNSFSSAGKRCLHPEFPFLKARGSLMGETHWRGRRGWCRGSG